MRNYCESEFHELLAGNGIEGFAGLWQLELDLVEPANERRGGWSHVCRLALTDELGRAHNFYIKRQYNHNNISFYAPWGEPTFARELRNICRYRDKNIGALDAVYYGSKKIDGRRAAVLVTRALDDYAPLDELYRDWASLEGDKGQLLVAVGREIGRLHSAGLAHHCLYPRHLFVARQDWTDLRFIDLEKTRIQLLRRRESIADLDAFMRRSGRLDDSERQLLLKAYLAHNPVVGCIEALEQALQLRLRNKAGRA